MVIGGFWPKSANHRKSRTNYERCRQEDGMEELANFVREIDMRSVDPSANLREALDIDSMDFLIL
jgi:hypothetical protein